MWFLCEGIQKHDNLFKYNKFDKRKFQCEDCDFVEKWEDIMNIWMLIMWHKPESPPSLDIHLTILLVNESYI